ncbi:MAG: selenium metabolism-associated LysR family transcriptional regulator [Candidatus Saccharibacteria bacterium]
MNFSLFKTFVRVVETQNLSRTAEELNISQPAVSKQIQALEEYFGVLLLERSGRRLKTTEAGDALYICAREVLKVMEKTTRVMEDVSDNRRGNLFVGASTVPGQYILPRFLKLFKEEYPNVNVYMEVADTEKIVSKVADRELDLGVVGAWLNNRKVDGFKWTEDELVLLVPSDHSLASYDEADLTALQTERWVFRERGSGTRVAADELFRSLGLRREDFNVQAELGSTTAIVGAVEAGLGLALVSGLVAQHWSNTGKVKVLRIKGEKTATREFYVIYPKQKNRRKTVDNFLDCLQRFKTKVNGLAAYILTVTTAYQIYACILAEDLI